jgi:hypothetical protein
MATLLTSSDLRAMGWTPALVKVLLGEPDEKEPIKKGMFNSMRHWYAQSRVQAAMESPAYQKATQARETRQARPELRRKGFNSKYQTWRAAVPDACHAQWSLNRYCKHSTCSQSNKAEIYGLKNNFVELLYTSGFCTAAWLHILVLPPKVCRACSGSGWDGECDRCDGTGEYLPAKRLKFYVFKISVGRSYCWHQPEILVKFPVVTTQEPAEWSGVERDKPLGMPRSQLAAAKDLIRWVLDQAKSAPQSETEVHFHETIPPIPETAEQGELFA